MKPYLAIFLFMLLISCNSTSEKKEITTTSIFSDYLNQQFNLSIPSEKHIFITLPKNGCKGAIWTSLTSIDQLLEPSDKISFIIADDVYASKFLKKNWKILFDKDDKLDRLNIPISNVSAIITENGKIKLIKSSTSCDNAILDIDIKELFEK